MVDTLETVEELDEQISAVRGNIRDLVEQAAVYSGPADDDLTTQRIGEQEALLERMRQKRAELERRR